MADQGFYASKNRHTERALDLCCWISLVGSLDTTIVIELPISIILICSLCSILLWCGTYISPSQLGNSNHEFPLSESSRFEYIVLPRKCPYITLQWLVFSHSYLKRYTLSINNPRYRPPWLSRSSTRIAYHKTGTRSRIVFSSSKFVPSCCQFPWSKNFAEVWMQQRSL